MNLMFRSFSFNFVRECDRFAEMRHRLLEGRAAQSILARVAPPFDRQIFIPGRGAVMRDFLRVGLPRDQRRSRVSVKCLTAASQEALVRRVLNQRVLEAVCRLWREAIDEEEGGVHETRQGELK